MKRRQILFNLLIPASAGILIFLYIFYGKYGFLPDPFDNLKYYFIAIVAGVITGITMGFLDVYFKRFWEENINLASLIGLQLSIKFIVAFLITGISCWLAIGFSKTFDISWIWQNYYDEILKLIILIAGSMLIYSLISFALQSYNYYAYHKIERLHQERKQIELQYDALKSQLSPHYLFNCLNTISSLIHKDARQTEDFIRRMAKTFQYVLTNDHKKLVKISEEVEFVKAYNYLLKVRFENQLTLNIDLSKNIMEGYIPPLTLQMLLENVVKHNIIDDNNKVTVHIYSTDGKTLVIENNKTSTPASMESFKIGLDNIIHRYQHLTTIPVRIKDQGHFNVFIPIIYETEEVYA